jgi:phosphinothricin acetyltransferase
MRSDVVRDACREDCEAIAGIYNEGIAEGRSTFETESRSAADIAGWLGAQRQPVLVVEDDGGVVGWARISPYSSRACYSGIGEASVYVHASARGRGLGGVLATALRERAKRDAFTKLLGKCFSENTAALRLVERHGFRTVGVHLRHGQVDGQSRDVVVVELLLGDSAG